VQLCPDSCTRSGAAKATRLARTFRALSGSVDPQEQRARWTRRNVARVSALDVAKDTARFSRVASRTRKRFLEMESVLEGARRRPRRPSKVFARTANAIRRETTRGQLGFRRTGPRIVLVPRGLRASARTELAKALSDFIVGNRQKALVRLRHDANTTRSTTVRGILGAAARIRGPTEGGPDHGRRCARAQALRRGVARRDRLKAHPDVLPVILEQILAEGGSPSARAHRAFRHALSCLKSEPRRRRAATHRRKAGLRVTERRR